MFTILGADGKEYGPVTAGKLHEWIAGGRANLQTKARRSGETEWRTIGDFPELAQFGTGGTTPPPLAPPPPAAAPVAAPAPVPAPLTGDARTIAADLVARTRPIDVFDCLAKSFELWKNNFFPLVGVTLLVLLVQTMLGMIPILGLFAGFCLNGVFYGGLYYYYLGKVRGQPREVGDAFAGFSRAFAPLMVATLISSAISLAVLAVCCAPLLGFIFASALNHNSALPVFTLPAIAGMLIGGLFALYLSISWAFAFMLVIDRGLSPWTAMEVSRRVVGRQWFRVFFVTFCSGILAMLGLIGLFVGVLFTLPLMFGAIIYAYEAACSPPPE